MSRLVESGQCPPKKELENKIMNKTNDIKPFDNCPALDGYHCQTNSLAKIFHHYDHPLSEDMILGLGAGM